MKKFIKYLSIFLLVGAVLWAALFFTVPQVKDLTLYKVFGIERTVEDDATNTEDETTNTEDESTDGAESVEDDTTSEENEEDKFLAPDYIPEDENATEE